MARKTSNGIHWKRREFLKGVTVSAGAAVATGAGPTQAQAPDAAALQCGDARCDYDTIVVGAGFAGITAARELSQAGQKVLVLEARNRLGGRTFTTEFEGHQIELGGAWIHWSQPYVWAETERYGLSIEETVGAVSQWVIVKVDDQAVTLDLEQYYAIVGAFVAYFEETYATIPRAFDLLHNRDAALVADSISAIEKLNALELGPVEHTAWEGILGSMAHNTPDQMSFLEAMRWNRIPGGDIQNFFDAITRYKIKEGTIGLIDRMAGDGAAEIRLSTPVTKIEDLGDLVRVSIDGSTLTAKNVVLTAANNTIGQMDIQPPLSSRRREASEEKVAGAGYKIFMRTSSKLDPVFLLDASDAPINTAFTYDTKGGDHSIIVGFGTDPEFDPNDTEAISAEIGKFLPGVEIVSSIYYDWNIDPYSQGTWSVYKPGWAAKYQDALKDHHGRIYFATGDHGEGWRGFIDGAIGSGLRTAEIIREREQA